MAKNNDMDYIAPYMKWAAKKYKDKPAPVRTLLYRTLSTATAVLTGIKDIPFEKLSFSLYFFCQDIQTDYFTRLYESQLELAGANPDKFVKGLHKFFNDTAAKIKKDDLYEPFFQFLSLCAEVRYQTKPTDSPEKNAVIDSYQSLLLQQTEYLRPNKFDFENIICGRTSAGEIMIMPDSYPFLDGANGDVERIVHEAIASGKPLNIDNIIKETYARFGYTDITDSASLDRASQMDRFLTHHQCALLPYINEYTYDILPDAKKPFTAFVLPLLAIHVKPDVDWLVDILKHRCKTLPSNGIRFDFNYEAGKSFVIDYVLMKEVLHGDAIVMLYKMHTDMGDLCGFYNTKSESFYSVLLEDEKPERIPYNKVRRLILYLYACAVTRIGPELLAKQKDLVFFASSVRDETRIYADITPLGMGGKLKNMYHKESRPGTGPRAGNDAYESEQRSIQGYVRKVGEGRRASEDAVARAKALGYDLNVDETYVQPFIKSVLRLKRKDPETT